MGASCLRIGRLGREAGVCALGGARLGGRCLLELPASRLRPATAEGVASDGSGGHVRRRGHGLRLRIAGGRSSGLPRSSRRTPKQNRDHGCSCGAEHHEGSLDPSLYDHGSFSQRWHFHAFKPFIVEKAMAIKDLVMLCRLSAGVLPRLREIPYAMHQTYQIDLCVLWLRLRGRSGFRRNGRRHWAAPWPSEGISLVYGGGNVGLMGTVARAVLDHRRPRDGDHPGIPEIPGEAARRRPGDHRRARHAHPQAPDVREGRCLRRPARAGSAPWRNSSSR